jgi:predicted nucleic acid-binding protein
MIGLDTGFFIELLKNKDNVIRVWNEIIEGRVRSFVSILSLFEFERLTLKGVFDNSVRDILLEAIKANCDIIGITSIGLIQKAAKISHGNGIPSVDSLILSSLLFAGAQKIYTTDSDFEAYKNKNIKIININQWN